MIEICNEDIVYNKSNYTSRNVIIPNHELHDNEVDMSYHTFLELFREAIIRYLMIAEGIMFNQAYEQWNSAKIQYSQKIYEIMCYIVEKEHPKILLNRNPTLNYYSMLLLDIRIVKCDFDDYTLSVPLSILPGMNADFDGDVLNIIGILNVELQYIFRKFNPVERMMMSRDTGLINPLFSISKGQLIDLLYFATCQKDVPVEEDVNKKKHKKDN